MRVFRSDTDKDSPKQLQYLSPAIQPLQRQEPMVARGRAAGPERSPSAANSLLIDFSKSGLGRARGAGWPRAVYMAGQECACSTTISACFLRRGGGEGGRLPRTQR